MKPRRFDLRITSWNFVRATLYEHRGNTDVALKTWELQRGSCVAFVHILKRRMEMGNYSYRTVMIRL